MTVLRRGVLLVLLTLAVAAPAHAAGTTTVVVTLDAPPLAQAVAGSRVLTAAARRAPLDVRAPTSVSYLRSLAQAQTAVARRIPGARVGWRYAVVLNGFSVTVPAAQLPRLAALPGVARVYPAVTYHSTLDRSVPLIGAPVVWGADRSTSGQDMKIAVIDDGIDPSHPFFAGTGLAVPVGFPKGDTAFTRGKIVVARAFPPKTPAWKNAKLPFDPLYSEHGTHVAGIAAGSFGTEATAEGGERRVLSGVAPGALLGNYKVLTIPTDADVGLDGNSPEIAAGIEAAVADGMNVINLSIGEPEVEPSRDLVVRALEGAAAAGVVPVVAAGNDYPEFGRGSVSSPGSTPSAITVAAVTKSRAIADFSSSGPTPLSLQLKPEVAAPGANIVSSVPRADGLWSSFSGTSMAAPHVAGAAALLKQRHPAWTVQQVKSALALTGDPMRGVTPLRQGGGVVNLPRADNPLVFSGAATLSFGLVAPGTSAIRSIPLTDAGGGGGAWRVSVEQGAGALAPTFPAEISVPAPLTVTLTVPASAPLGESSGWIVLTRGSEQRRIAWWAEVTRNRLSAPVGTLAKQGDYRGTTRGRPSRVSDYLFPSGGGGSGVVTRLTGPEVVYRVRIAKPVANFGVVITSRASASVEVFPRIVHAGDEHRLAGYAALPLNLNPYLRTFLQPEPVAGVALPAAGLYDVVFDTTLPSRAGAFGFRFWVDDTTPPKARVVARVVRRGRPLQVALSDGGSRVDPTSVYATVDGAHVTPTYAGGILSVSTRAARPGTHRLVLQVSDFQEAKNNENQPRILGNTTRLAVNFRVR
jgi:subtilisin family serine protease